MQVIVDDLLINYDRQGKGKKIVLLHGWNDNSKGLQLLIKYLSKDFEVITPDIPGFGGSDTPKTAWGLDDFAALIKHFLNKIDVNQIECLIGHSNGGSIAIKAVSSSKLNPTKLILIGSAGIRSNKKGKLKTIKLATKTGKLISSPLPKNLKNKLRKKLYNQIGSDLLVAEHMEPSFKKIISEDLQVDATKLKLPTLLIYGEQDNMTPATDGMLYHELIEGSTLEIVADAGHFVHLDQNKIVENLIKEFLN